MQDVLSIENFGIRKKIDASLAANRALITMMERDHQIALQQNHCISQLLLQLQEEQKCHPTVNSSVAFMPMAQLAQPKRYYYDSSLPFRSPN
jgi:hypothetical protein